MGHGCRNGHGSKMSYQEPHQPVSRRRSGKREAVGALAGKPLHIIAGAVAEEGLDSALTAALSALLASLRIQSERIHPAVEPLSQWK